MKIYANTTESRVYTITIPGRHNEEAKDSYINAIECADSIENAVRGIIDEGAMDVTVDAGSLTGFDIMAEIAGKH